MAKIFQFLSHIKNTIEFIQLPKRQRRLVFYSEGINYWPHLESLITNILAETEIPVCYISSGEGDPGSLLEHPNYRSFKIDEGFVRDWLFENIETDVMVMTMPDLHQYQVKRSKHKVHYVYVHHSMVSLHMVYREGAFDYFDTFFCVGPHHVKEIRAIESQYNLPEKNLVEHGYSRLDSIIEESAKRPRKKKPIDAPKHVLIAPSWGEHGTIETGIGETIVDQLITKGYQVTLRPHPQTFKFAKDKIEPILQKHRNSPLFSYEGNVAGQNSLHDSDLMISDWSGAALDYAFGLNKPVLFVDIPRKINNKKYKDINLQPLEVDIRESLGGILDVSHSFDCGQALSQLEISEELIKDKSKYVFNIGRSGIVGCEAIRRICGED